MLASLIVLVLKHQRDSMTVRIMKSGEMCVLQTHCNKSVRNVLKCVDAIRRLDHATSPDGSCDLNRWHSFCLYTSTLVYWYLDNRLHHSHLHNHVRGHIDMSLEYSLHFDTENLLVCTLFGCLHRAQKKKLNRYEITLTFAKFAMLSWL